MDIVTSDLSKFDHYELKSLSKLLTAYLSQGVPEDFVDDGVTICLNTRSRCVFLTNEDCQAAMLNNGNLETFYTCSNCGEEGFKEDIKLSDDGDYCEFCHIGVSDEEEE